MKNINFFILFIYLFILLKLNQGSSIEEKIILNQVVNVERVDSITHRPPIQVPPISSEQNLVIRPPLIPQSPIGYEVPCGVRHFNTERIVGGSSAKKGEFPWQISLQLISGFTPRHICGGALLSANWIVTAAHCVFGLSPEQLHIVAGEHDLYSFSGDEQRRCVVRILLDDYISANFSRDIALLQADHPFSLDPEIIAPICLPQHLRIYNFGNATVSGWGRLAEQGDTPHILQYVTLPIIRRNICHRAYRQEGYANYLNPCQLCSGLSQGGIDSCQGDSGGPLACRHSDGRYYLCGVVSWGVGCARPGLPGVYTSVPCFSGWITRILYNIGHELDPNEVEEHDQNEKDILNTYLQQQIFNLEKNCSCNNFPVSFIVKLK